MPATAPAMAVAPPPQSSEPPAQSAAARQGCPCITRGSACRCAQAICSGSRSRCSSSWARASACAIPGRRTSRVSRRSRATWRSRASGCSRAWAAISTRTNRRCSSGCSPSVIRIFGSVKASFLIPSFLAAGGILFLVYDFGRRTVGREAGLAAALITVCTLQFVTVTRGAQIDATLCFLTTLSLYSLLRHLLLGPAWGWYFIGGFAAGLGVFTKGVGFLPMLVLAPIRRVAVHALAGTGDRRWRCARLALVARAARDDPRHLVVVRADADRRCDQRLAGLRRVSRRNPVQADRRAGMRRPGIT